MKEKIFICILLFNAFFYTGFSQQSKIAGACKIKGKLIDSTTSQPVDYATIVAFLAPGDSLAGGIITDDKGQFTIDNLAPGTYRLKIEFIGYNPINKTGIVVTDKKPVINVGNIKLVGNSKSLKEVAVTGSKKFMENHLDKLVYNVEKDITSQGGVATDVLKKVPMVSVDIDGNLELLGDQNVRVFINGKPSAMFDNNLTEALAAIPASQIKSIEVITNPGAQYDAQGTGGIINIILKDNKQKGINGNVTLSGGSRYQNGSANVHIKNGNLDVNASVNGNLQLDTKTLTSYNRSADSAGLTQDGYNTVHRDGYGAHTGFDWAVTKNDFISGGVSYNDFGNTNVGSVSQDQTIIYPNPADTITIRNSNNYYRYRGEDWNLSYKKKFGREGQEIGIYFQGSTSTSDVTYQQDQYYEPGNSEFNGARGGNTITDNENYLTLDYTRPFSDNAQLNVGVKGTFSDLSSNTDHYLLSLPSEVYTPDLSQQDNFNFRRSIYAAYASFTCKVFKNYDVKLGVRDEYTITAFPTDTIAIPAYNFITPSATISRKLKNDQTIKISYTRRIQRPGFYQYNPFVNATDPANLTTGYPGITPEKNHAVELSYYKFSESGSSLLVTLFYRYSGSDWQSHSYYYDSVAVGNTVYRNVTVASTINAATENQGGLSINGTWAVTKHLEIRCNGSVFDKYIVPIGGGTIVNSTNYRANLNATYKFTKDLTAEFYSNYNSPRYEAQGKYPSFASYSFAVRQQVLNKKGSIAFTTTDPFNKYTTQSTYISGENFSSVSTRRYPYQIFGLSFSYKFGKIEFKENKKENENENTPENNSGGENK